MCINVTAYISGPTKAKKKSRAEILEKKRLAERRRKERIRNDPERYARSKERSRQYYLENKKSGKLIPMSELSPQEQKIKRKKNREYFRSWYKKNKMDKTKNKIKRGRGHKDEDQVHSEG
ncbi:hypothetical protein PYW07_016459 [Mythimna separata]|uniref:Uncharacterized protein n=1 Tax=Mythimna separata TaxID=271217 RepID=A0AAD7YL47_MYTSE|nr:hypothetical protein PYW07_016459 [Mythimna separata]